MEEFGVTSGDSQNAVVIKRNVDGVVSGLLEARERRELISENVYHVMQTGWSYGPPARRADYYFNLFRALIQRGRENVTPFCYMDKTPEEI